MALNIKDAETEALAGKVAALAGETKTGAVRVALRERLDRLQAHNSSRTRRGRLQRVLEEEVWPLVPDDARGQPLTKAEREEILGIGPEGV